MNLTKNLFIVCCLSLIGGSALAGDAGKGQEIFVKQCAFCHAADNNAKASLQGPTMVGVAGRPLGTVEGYTYTSAIKRAAKQQKLVWTDENLDAYIKNPNGLIQGTRMVFAGIADEKERADLIAYLKTLK